MEQRVEAPATIRTRRRSGGFLAWTAFVLITAAIAATVWWERAEPAGQEASGGGHAAQPPMVGTASVAKGDINVTINGLGTVTSLATVTVKPQISGQLTAVNFEEGQEVRKGDLLAEIDSRPYEAALAQVKGQLARDQALLANAQLDLKRDQDLVTKNFQTKQALDAQTALVAQYQGTILSDNALIQAAMVSLDYCRITSLIDGRAGLRQVDAGNYVTSSEGIVIITQLEPISVLFTVPEDDLPAISERLTQGAALPVAAFDRSGQKKLAQGTLTTFDSQIDSTTGTIKLRATFPNGERSLYPNQFVNVVLTVDAHKDVATLPLAAVQRGVPGTFVYLVNDDSTVSVRKITLGVSEGERTEVVSGLVPGDRVVVDGADRLRDGAKVVPATLGDSGDSVAPGESGSSVAPGDTGANAAPALEEQGGRKKHGARKKPSGQSS